ncbi:MAG: histidine kinase dimerization/phospho-acceptor domain-containing protein, partial [Myxococcota bacterium]
LEQARRQVVTAELAGAAAHELNQPLTSALGYAELLKMRLPENDPSHGAADMVLEQIRRMAQIVRRMGQLNTYKTRTYIGHTQIVDLSSTDVGAGDE